MTRQNLVIDELQLETNAFAVFVTWKRKRLTVFEAFVLVPGR